MNWILFAFILSGGLTFYGIALIIICIHQICRDLRMVAAYLYDIEQMRRQRHEHRLRKAGHQ